MTTDDDIEQMAAENLALVLEDGPRIRSDYNTWALARGDGGRVLRGGLGGFGHGRMWGVAFDDEDASDAPYDPDMRDDFGGTGYAEDTDRLIRWLDNEARKFANEVKSEAYTALREHLRLGGTTFTWHLDAQFDLTGAIEP